VRGRATGAALPALVVLALVAVVAIAATGSTSHGTGATRRPADSLLDAFFTLGLVAIVVGGVLLVYGLTQRKAIAREVATGKYRNSLLGWVMLAVVYVAVWYFRPQDVFRDSDQGLQDAIKPEAGPTAGSPDTSRTTPYEAEISWLALALVAGLAAAGVAAYLSSTRRRRDRAPGERTLAEQLVNALDDSLDDLRAEGDPRRAIIAAFARLERVLAAGGVPRRPAETAQEYVARVLQSLALEPGAIQRLTSLFSRAKFSLHEVDETMKEEAIDALEEVRDELRVAEERSRVSESEQVTAGATS
jgi:uncharacterized membrane protein YidH (DUF202 family)